MNKTSVKPGDIITSIERGLNVLRCFDQHAIEMTPADVSKRTGLPRAATRRILITLEHLGYAVSDGKHFRLTPKVLDLAHGYLAKEKVGEMIEPILIKAREEIQESCALMIRDGTDMICIASSNSAIFGSVVLDIGTRRPLHVSSSGRALLAYLPEYELDAYLSTTKLEKITPKTITKKPALKQEILKTRTNGYASTSEEFSIGVFSMGVPVMQKPKEVIAGVSCIGNIARMKSRSSRDHIVAVLNEAADRIAELLPDDYDFSSDRSSVKGAIK